MAWKFDPIKIDLVWATTSSEIIEYATLDSGDIGGDLYVDTGDRSNDSSTLDQGLRVVDGSI